MPLNRDIIDTKPEFEGIGHTTSTFQKSTVQWSDTVVTWSSSTALWGGSDSRQDFGGNPSIVQDIKPINEGIANP